MATEGDLKKAFAIENFSVDPREPNAEKPHEFWKTRFGIYLTNLNVNDQQKLQILTNKLNAETYEYIDGLTDYNEAIQKLITCLRTNPIFYSHVIN